MTLPIRLNTKYGIEQFNMLQSQFIAYSKFGSRDEFKARCKEDLNVQLKYLQYFLDDDTMSKKYKMNEEDIEGFRIFREHSDMCSALKYFSEKSY